MSSNARGVLLLHDESEHTWHLAYGDTVAWRENDHTFGYPKVRDENVTARCGVSRPWISFEDGGWTYVTNLEWVLRESETRLCRTCFDWGLPRYRLN